MEKESKRTNRFLRFTFWITALFIPCYLFYEVLEQFHEIEIGTSLSVEKSQSSTIFIFYKDGAERKGDWNTCLEELCEICDPTRKYGQCGGYNVDDKDFLWSLPITRDGGSVMLEQQIAYNGFFSSLGKEIMGKEKKKYKFFSTSHTWQKDSASEKWVVVVKGVDKHIYGFPPDALQKLVNLRDIYMSPKWRLILEPIIPEEVKLKPMSLVHNKLPKVPEDTPALHPLPVAIKKGVRFKGDRSPSMSPK